VPWHAYKQIAVACCHLGVSYWAMIFVLLGFVVDVRGKSGGVRDGEDVQSTIVDDFIASTEITASCTSHDRLPLSVPTRVYIDQP